MIPEVFCIPEGIVLVFASRIPRNLLTLALLVILVLLSALPAHLTPLAPVATASAQSPCDGLIEPRLQNGGQARVITTYGLSMKNEPRTGAAGAVEVALLTYDTVVTVTGGYTCNLGYLWWPLQLPDGTSGWAAEGGTAGDYYMEPVTVGLHSFVTRDDGATLDHYWVTPDGAAELRGTISVTPVETTPADSWQLVEVNRLRELLDDARNACPDRLTGTEFEGGDVVGSAVEIVCGGGEQAGQQRGAHGGLPLGERVVEADHVEIGPFEPCFGHGLR